MAGEQFIKELCCGPNCYRCGRVNRQGGYIAARCRALFVGLVGQLNRVFSTARKSVHLSPADSCSRRRPRYSTIARTFFLFSKSTLPYTYSWIRSHPSLPIVSSFVIATCPFLVLLSRPHSFLFPSVPFHCLIFSVPQRPQSPFVTPWEASRQRRRESPMFAEPFPLEPQALCPC